MGAWNFLLIPAIIRTPCSNKRCLTSCNSIFKVSRQSLWSKLDSQYKSKTNIHKDKISFQSFLSSNSFAEANDELENWWPRLSTY